MPTCLDAANYDSREDAPSGSWYVERVGTGDGSGFGGSGGFDGGSGGQEKKDKEKQTCKRRRSGDFKRWTPEEEVKLKEVKLKGEKWQAIAEELGTGRTPEAVHQHWKLMNKKQKRQGRAQVEEQDEALDAGGNESSEEEVDVVDLPAEEVPEVYQVVEVTASAKPPEQQTRACELVLVPFGDDAREEVSASSRSVEPYSLKL